MKKFIFLFFIAVFIGFNSFADTVYFKDGKSIEGQIIEKTDEYVRLDFEGMILTYWLDEIERLEINKGSSSSPVVDDGPEKSSIVNPRTFLWEVRSENSSANTVYILGSMHIARETLYPLDKRIEDAFGKTDILAVEVNLSEVDNLLVLNEFMVKGIYSEGDTLEARLSNKTFELVKKKTQELGMDMEEVNICKPWFLALNLVTTESLKLGFDAKYGIDNHFLEKAKGVKNIVGIETVDYQISLFDSFSDKQQELFLFNTLVDLDILGSEIERIVDIWKKGDIDGMEFVLRKGLRDYPELADIYEVLIYNRNRNMVVKIESFLKTGNSHFVILGAAHLVGPEGVIWLLREKGYLVQQL